MIQRLSKEYEKKRLQTLMSYDILDIPAEKELDDITRLASMICETPICLISLLDDTRQCFKSRVGLEPQETAKSMSFCLHAIQQDEVFEVRNALEDKRFDNDPLVLDYPFIRFYAGMPLKTPDGYNLGTLCIIDTKPRILNNKQRSVLQTLSSQIMTNFELRKNNKELKLMNEKAMKLAETKDCFLTNMSHELRTPLNAIYGFTELLHNTNLDSNQKEHVSIIKSSVEILKYLVNDILDYSKLENNKLHLEKNPFDLRDLIKGMYELYKIKAQQKNLSLRINIDRTIPSYLYGDKLRLHQILMNLLGNAIKFTNAGSVILNIRQVDETQEDIQISFSVIDTGIGIDQDKLTKIFDRFQQAHGTTSMYSGTGLGLSITKSLVELQQGEIKVKSLYGKGSEFCFDLRYNKIKENEMSRLIQEEKRQFNMSNYLYNKLKILLVEDVDVNIRLIEKILEGKGIELDTAKNGRICIDKLEKNEYDLILMDLQMPEMNGYEATSYIRNILVLDIPIIALSANISEIEIKKCIEIGMNEYITKPFKIDHLFSCMSECLKMGKYINNSKPQKNVYIKSPYISREQSNNFKTYLIQDSESNAISSKTLKIFMKSYHHFKNIAIKDRKGRKFGKIINNNFSKLLLNPSQENSLTRIENQSKKTQEKNINKFEIVNINCLKEYTGYDNQLEKEIMEKFLVEIPEYVQELEDEIFKENFVNIKKSAHKIKSPVAMFGLEELRNKLKEIEDFSEKNEISKIFQIFSKCKCQLQENFNEINSILTYY